MLKRILLRTMAGFLLAIGVICLIFPFASLFLPGGPMLVLDTRAYFKKAHSGEFSPRADNVRCWAETFGTRGRGGNGPMVIWDCEITYDAIPDVAVTDAAAQTDTQGVGNLYAPIGKISSVSSETISRQLPFDRTGDIPQLRLMSTGRDAPVYGVVWGRKELLSRWMMWAVLSLLFLVFAAGCMFAAKRGWQKV
jgi:hypothetical protein